MRRRACPGGTPGAKDPWAPRHRRKDPSRPPTGWGPACPLGLWASAPPHLLAGAPPLNRLCLPAGQAGGQPGAGLQESTSPRHPPLETCVRCLTFHLALEVWAKPPFTPSPYPKFEGGPPHRFDPLRLHLTCHWNLRDSTVVCHLAPALAALRLGPNLFTFLIAVSSPHISSTHSVPTLGPAPPVHWLVSDV